MLELFTFLRVGGTRDRMCVYNISGDENLLASFDAAKARCFVPNDRERLLGIIESGFGDFRPFNKIVRSLLAREPALAGGKTKNAADLKVKKNGLALDQVSV